MTGSDLDRDLYAIERNPYRVEFAQLKGSWYYEIIRLDHPDRHMQWLGGPFDTEDMALMDAESRLEGLLPRCVAYSLTQVAFNLPELLGVKEALERDGKDTGHLEKVIALVSERVEAA